MISILTLTYNKKELLLKLANSIQRHCQNPNSEWIVVDNGTDGSDEALCEFIQETEKMGPFIRTIRSNNAGNFASMVNKFVPECQGDKILFLNNDVELHSDVPSIAESILNEKPDVGCVSGILTYPSDARKNAGLVQHAGIVIQNEFGPANMGVQWAQRNNLPPQILANIKSMPFAAVTAACMAMRVADFNALGGFREEFSWCFDDVDLGLRVTHDLGKTCLVDSRIQGAHVEAATDRERNAELNYRLLKGYWETRVRPDSHLYAAQLRAALEFIPPSIQTK